MCREEPKYMSLSVTNVAWKSIQSAPCLYNNLQANRKDLTISPRASMLIAKIDCCCRCVLSNV